MVGRVKKRSNKEKKSQQNLSCVRIPVCLVTGYSATFICSSYCLRGSDKRVATHQVIITGTLHIGALLEPLLLFKWGQPKYTQVRNSIQLNKCGKGTNIDTAEDFLRVYMVCTPYLFYPFLLSIMPVTPYVSSHYFCIKIPRNRY